MHGVRTAELPSDQGNSRNGAAGADEVLPKTSEAHPPQRIAQKIGRLGRHGLNGCSSIGRAPDSKSGGWGFDSLRPCFGVGCHWLSSVDFPLFQILVECQMSSKSAGASLLPEMFRFGIHKSNQGRMVRQFTFFAIVVVAAFGCITLSNGPLMSYAKGIQVGVPAALWLICCWVAFRMVNYPRFADFLVSVESELEKVTWPGRQEVLQATVVVLCTMFFLGLFLFLIDLLWTWLFNFIGFTEYNKKS